MKDPAFLFYPNDFESATKFFTDAQVGIYLRLLITQFQHGRLSEKQILFIAKSWDVDIMSKFSKDENELFFNERLEFEINKRKNFTESRRKNGKNNKSTSEAHDKHMLKHMDKHMENENENENINEININNGKNFEYNDITTLPNNYLQSCREQLYATQGLTIDPDTILKLWEAFRLEKLTGKNWYKSENDFYQHFANWIKKQKFTQKKLTKTEQDEAILREHANRYAPKP